MSVEPDKLTDGSDGHTRGHPGDPQSHAVPDDSLQRVAKLVLENFAETLALAEAELKLSVNLIKRLLASSVLIACQVALAWISFLAIAAYFAYSAGLPPALVLAGFLLIQIVTIGITYRKALGYFRNSGIRRTIELMGKTNHG